METPKEVALVMLSVLEDGGPSTTAMESSLPNCGSVVLGVIKGWWLTQPKPSSDWGAAHGM